MPESGTHSLRCHHCSHWIGEADRPMQIVGVFKDRRQRERIPCRNTWPCGKCGWSNVFEPAAKGETPADWRTVELKGA